MEMTAPNETLRRSFLLWPVVDVAAVAVVVVAIFVGSSGGLAFASSSSDDSRDALVIETKPKAYRVRR
jgi:hypothetical protein